MRRLHRERERKKATEERRCADLAIRIGVSSGMSVQMATATSAMGNAAS
jgi:hypothetical protein